MVNFQIIEKNRGKLYYVLYASKKYFLDVITVNQQAVTEWVQIRYEFYVVLKVFF